MPRTYAPIDLADVAQGQGGFVIQGEHPGDFAGRSVASAGDLNGDGFDDLIVGAEFATFAYNARDSAGAAYVVFGKAGGFGAAILLAAVAQGQGGFVIQSEDAGDRTGRSVACAGDLNGDGFDDLIVGAFRADAAGNAKKYAGAAYVVFGKAAGFSAAVDLSQVARGRGGFVIQGEDSGDYVGFSVASAGDLNGDGFDDLIVGAYRADAAGNAKDSSGAAYVVFGKAAAFGAAVDLTSVAQGQDGFVIQGEDAGDFAGISVASAGDLNGDGFDDLIVGASNADFAGAAYVVFGKAAGFGAAIDLAAVALGQGGFVIQGEDPGDYAGFSVASAGDLNGDGFDDLIVGASGATAAGSARGNAGAAYVVFGKAADFGASVDLAQVARGQGGFVIQGEDADDRAGFSVASAGDLNGDGFDDLIVGAPLADAAGNAKKYAGAAYVVFGKAAGFGAEIDLADVALGHGGFVIQGQDYFNLAGSSVVSAGDLNGDGFDDLIVGAYQANNTESSAGAVYVIFGGPFLGVSPSTLGTAGDDRLDGTADADAIDALAGRDFLRGRQGADTLAGGDGNDRLHGNGDGDLLAGGESNDRLIGGHGADTLAGGQGDDVFRYRNADQGGDLVLDFATGTDAFEFSAAGFGGGLTGGVDLGASGRFVANASGTTTSAAGVGQFVYDTDDGLLLWDADGAGGATAVLLATLDDAPPLTAADLRVIA